MLLSDDKECFSTDDHLAKELVPRNTILSTAWNCVSKHNAGDPLGNGEKLTDTDIGQGSWTTVSMARF